METYKHRSKSLLVKMGRNSPWLRHHLFKNGQSWTIPHVRAKVYTLVRMMLDGHLSVRLLDIILGGILLDPECRVEALGICRSLSSTPSGHSTRKISITPTRKATEEHIQSLAML